MSWSDESLSAFLDSELPAAEMEQLARDLETDAALAARL
jgi:anti-sigma factor RsiW